MRLLLGTKITEAEPDWRQALPRRPVLIDLGAGDGRFAYEQARHDPENLYVAVDADSATLSEYAFKAARKPSRGGIGNAIFVVAAAEALPEELAGIASLIRVNFPWGSLLRGLVLPEPTILKAVAGLASPDARFEFVICYDPIHDLAGLGGEPLKPLDQTRIDTVLEPAYAAAGLLLKARRKLDLKEALAIPSTWGRRLAYGHRRDVFLIEGSFQV